MIRRKLFNLSTVLSLLLCAATIAMWARSYWISDSWEWHRHYRTRFVAINRGRVLVQVNHGPSGTEEFSPIDHYAYVMKPTETRGLGRPWRFGGFWVENLSFAPTASGAAWLPYTDVVVPLYAPAHREPDPARPDASPAASRADAQSGPVPQMRL